MKPAPEHPWPPLITSAKVSRIIRVRDWLLTLIAWIALAYLMRLGPVLLWDYFSHPHLELTWMKALNWSLFWERFIPFLFMILAVVTWITVWAMKRRGVLRRSFDPRPPAPPLPLEEHAASLRLDPREIERWRQWRIVTVHFDGDRIATAQSGRRDGLLTNDSHDSVVGGA